MQTFGAPLQLDNGSIGKVPSSRQIQLENVGDVLKTVPVTAATSGTVQPASASIVTAVPRRS